MLNTRREVDPSWSTRRSPSMALRPKRLPQPQQQLLPRRASRQSTQSRPTTSCPRRQKLPQITTLHHRQMFLQEKFPIHSTPHPCHILRTTSTQGRPPHYLTVHHLPKSTGAAQSPCTRSHPCRAIVTPSTHPPLRSSTLKKCTLPQVARLLRPCSSPWT